ncbi:MAG: 30S ribosomal protein S14 [Gammaproteobacteria bacterium]
MAKKSMIAREVKREKLRLKYQEKRARLKEIIRHPDTGLEERDQALLDLQKIPLNASPVRRQRRCAVTGRPHGVYRKFSLSRNKLREYSMDGLIPGLKKASW